MSIRMTPGNAIGFPINAHRHGWNGAICNQPAAWNCRADLEFRESKCERGMPHCYHLNVFKAASPSVVVDDNGIGWILGDTPDALTDQVLLLWAPEASEPRGVRESGRVAEHVVGAYRIRTVEREEHGWRTVWRILPYPDGWSRFWPFKVDRPRYSHMAGRYVREVERSQIVRSFRAVAESAESNPEDWADPGDKERFFAFYHHIESWLDAAAIKMEAVLAQAPGRGQANTEVWSSGGVARQKFFDIAKVVESKSGPGETAPDPDPAVVDAAAEQATPPEVVTEPPAPSGASAPRREQHLCIEPGRLDWIRECYGDPIEQRLRVAGMTKSMIVFCGHPGVGKSYLALRLLDDPERERTIAIPVSSTWRGREDLLGYVNPVSNEFEPTAFTRFLIRAEQAWFSGDKRPRNVIFEEFNLSQPEHWLSDVLAVSQYEAEGDRYIELGGRAIAGSEPTAQTRVFLSPAVSFLATINNDHTTRPLSPRVLDRAALIELRMETKEVLARVGATVLADELEAISDLDFHLRSRGASFSVRAATSLRRCLDSLESLGLERWRAIDLVLVQEVLSKVRLMARDPNDEALILNLKKWGEQYGRHLSLASSVIAEWEDALNSGADVAQA